MRPVFHTDVQMCSTQVKKIVMKRNFPRRRGLSVKIFNSNGCGIVECFYQPGRRYSCDSRKHFFFNFQQFSSWCRAQSIAERSVANHCEPSWLKPDNLQYIIGVMNMFEVWQSVGTGGGIVWWGWRYLDLHSDHDPMMIHWYSARQRRPAPWIDEANHAVYRYFLAFVIH